MQIDSVFFNDFYAILPQQKLISQLYDKDMANSVTSKLPYLSLLEKQNIHLLTQYPITTNFSILCKQKKVHLKRISYPFKTK